MSKPMPPACRLYLITPPAIDDLGGFARGCAEALDGGDVAALQIRLKDVSDEIIAAAVDVLTPICMARDVAVILNDRPDLAARFGCDGVHIGQSDARLAEARRLMGKDRSVGVTCHDSRHLAMEAAEGGADYVAFGAFFDTMTKDSGYRPDPEVLTIWQETMEVPCVAIGGIKPDNAAGLVAAGADFIAVVTGVWDDPQGPGHAVKAYNAAIAEGLAARQAHTPDRHPGRST